MKELHAQPKAPSLVDWEIGPNDLMAAAWKLYDHGDFQQALHVWKSIRKLFPSESEAYRGAALAHKRLADYASANAALCEGLKLHPRSRPLLGDYAQLAQEQKNWADALERWVTYINLSPEDFVGPLGASVALRELERYDEAEDILRAALQEHPDNSQLIAGRAYVAQQRNDWERAIKYWNVFREKFPDDPIGYSSIGVALMTLQRFKEADAVLEKV